MESRCASLGATIRTALGTLMPNRPAAPPRAVVKDWAADIPRRSEFLARLAAQGTGDEEEGGRGLAIWNLDGFRRVNEVHGTEAGDALLRQAADRLMLLSGRERLLGHLGGDEFAMGFPAGPEDAATVAKVMLQATCPPFTIGVRSVPMRASVGVAVGRGGAVSELLRAAGIAMDRAKSAGGGRWMAFDGSMDCTLRDRASLEADFEAALAREEILPFYQPVHLLKSGALSGFEILARWVHPERGMVYPGVMIPLAQRIGATEALCGGLLRQACRDARDWPDYLTLSINLSPAQLDDPALSRLILKTLQAGGMAPHRLFVEVTQGVIPTEATQVAATITALKAVGVRIMLDDFSAGACDLQRLKAVKVDAIKTDRALLGMIGDPAGYHALKSIVDLGGKLGAPVIAKGIETMEQAYVLARLGCSHGQGFAFGKPRPGVRVPPLFGSRAIERRAALRLAG